jgi:hypothetical protein
MASPNVERLEIDRQDANETLIPTRDLFWPKYTPPTPAQRQAWLKQTWPDLDGFLATWEALRQIQRDLEICPLCGRRGLYATRGEYWIFRCYDCGHKDHNLDILEGKGK